MSDIYKEITKGLHKGLFKKLEQVFPYQRPTEKQTIESIQRAAGREDVMDYIRRNFVDES